MKKKYLSLILAFTIFLPCLLLLSACGGKKVTNIVVENLFIGERKVEYQYGTGINDIISTNVNVTAYYDDNSTKVLGPSEFKIKYYKDNQEITNIKAIPDVGYYSVSVSYENMQEVSSFSIIQSVESPYKVSLTKRSWFYGEELPTVSLHNYELKEGETVDYYYVEKSVYDELTEEQKANYYNYGIMWPNSSTYLYAGEYYVFAKINFVEASNYIGLTTVDSSCLIKVKKETIIIDENVINEFNIKAMPFDYIQSFGEEGYVLGDITLSDIAIDGDVIYLDPKNDELIQGELRWVDPDLIINSSNDGNSYPVKFVPYNFEDEENYDYICDLSLTVEINKGILANTESMKMVFDENKTNSIAYDGNAHSILLEGFSSIVQYGGVVANTVSITDKNGNDVKIRYEESEGGLVSFYIDGLVDAGEYEYTISISDTTNYTWENGTTDSIKFTVKIN